MLGFDGEYLAGHPKFSLKTPKKSAVKHSIQKLILLNFVNLFTTFCTGFQHFVILNNFELPPDSTFSFCNLGSY